MELQKTKFNDKMVSTNFSNSGYVISRDEYATKLQRLLDVQNNHSIKKNWSDYKMGDRFDVLSVTIEGITVQKLVKKGTELRFVCKEVLFFIDKLF